MNLQTQALGSIAPGVLNQVQNSVANPLNFNNAPAMPTDQTAAINNAYGALMSRQNTALNQQQDATKAQLGQSEDQRRLDGLRQCDAADRAGAQ